MAYEWVRMGIKCVCVKEIERHHPKVATLPRPVKGGIYTISFAARAGEWIGLKELHPISAFHAEHFKPLISQADDVELFKRISEDSLGRLEVLEGVLNEQY